MNGSEYIIVLFSVVVGLAVADMATSLHRLLRAGRRVTWDWVAPLAASLMLLELFNLWWKLHDFGGNTIGEAIPYFAVLLLLFLAASASLPDDVPPGEFDVGAYFDQTRPYFWSVYFAYVATWVGFRIFEEIRTGATFTFIIEDRWEDFVTLSVRFALIFIRPRIWSGLALAGIAMWLAYNWLPMAL